MRALTLLAVLTSIGAARVAAQYAPDTTHRLVSDVFISIGGQAETGGRVWPEDGSGQASGSSLFSADLSDHQGYRHDVIAVQGGPAFHVALGLTLKENRARGTSTKLRAGVGFAQYVTPQKDYQRTERFPYDTLTSSGSGAYVYLDSVSTSTYFFENEHQRLGIDLALLFVKDFPGHWMLYGGFGATFGGTLAGVSTAIHRTENYIEGVEGTNYNNDNTRTEVETMRTKSTFFVNTQIPLGIGYRLAKRHPFWRSLILTMEMQPAITIGGEPANDQTVRAGFNFLWGLRVDLNQ
jgi:hypothetical protein